MYENLAIIAVFVFLYSMISGRVERTPINGAVVYTAFGLVFGPLGLGFLNLEVDMEILRTLAELTLALVLFTDAANADLGVLKKNAFIPQRLLLIGLPLTILLGFGVGLLIFQKLSILEVVILSTMLAPTDAALGKAVVSDPAVPADIREGLNVESGLNDGICVPILLVFLTLATQSGLGQGPIGLALTLVIREIGIGMAVGIGLTFLGSRLLNLLVDRGWMTETWRQIPVAALALACFSVAQSWGGSGFIASFTGGLLFGGLVKRHKHALLLATEGIGDTFALVTWVTFGTAVVGQTVLYFSWDVMLYSVLSLTLIRMLPVFVTLTGIDLRTDEKLFMGWFGPRGLASIVFVVIVLAKDLPHGGTLGITVVCTVVLSVLTHGLSANPLVSLLQAREKREKRIPGPDQAR